MPIARKVWQLAAAPRPTLFTRRLIIRNTSTRLIRRVESARVRVRVRQSGVPVSSARPALCRVMDRQCVVLAALLVEPQPPARALLVVVLDMRTTAETRAKE